MLFDALYLVDPTTTILPASLQLDTGLAWEGELALTFPGTDLMTIVLANAHLGPAHDNLPVEDPDQATMRTAQDAAFDAYRSSIVCRAVRAPADPRVDLPAAFRYMCYNAGPGSPAAPGKTWENVDTDEEFAIAFPPEIPKI